MDIPDKDIGQRIRDLRKAQGISAFTLGEAIGISAPFIYDIEKGKSKPRLGTLTKIADFFGVSTDFLLRGDVGEVPQKKNSPTEFFPQNPYYPVSKVPVFSRLYLMSMEGEVRWPPMSTLMKEAMDFIVWPHNRLKVMNNWQLPDAYAIYADEGFENLRSLNIYNGDQIVVIPRNTVEDGALMLVNCGGVPLFRYVYDQQEKGILLRDDNGNILVTPERQKEFGFAILGLVVGCVCFHINTPSRRQQ